MHGGSSYFEAPEYIKKKQCLVNIKNYGQKCFVWSVLASLYPQKQNADQVSKCQPLERNLNLQDLEISTSAEASSSLREKQPDDFAGKGEW